MVGHRMPLPVRVDPLSALHAVEVQGTRFGNRGGLHDDAGRIVRGWQGRRWIVCTLEFRGRRREIMPPGRYTGLFFRDDWTAFAAGHRPCAECRRADFDAFRAAWPRAAKDVASIDAVLHAERLADDARPRDGAAPRRRLHPVPPDFPDGTFLVDDAGPLVVHGGVVHRWSFTGDVPADPVGDVHLLTPPSLVEVLRRTTEAA